MLNKLARVWGAVAEARARLYQHGQLEVHRLPRPAISVGGISIGGSGKTPAVAAITGLLLEAGQRPAILSRGYRRRGRTPLLVSHGDGRGPLVSVRRAGDEPTWLARLFPTAVVAVAAHRERAAELALAAASVDVFVLDDAFQHLRVSRQADCLVVDSAAPFWCDAPVPAGRLRERHRAAARADAFLLVGDDLVAAEVLEQRYPDRPVFRLRSMPPLAWAFNDYGRSRAADDVSGAPARGLEPAAVLALSPAQLPRPLYAFAGIARPQRFFDGLSAAGIELAGHHRFPDHHFFRPSGLARVADAARAAGAAGLITTEKDAVRIGSQALDLPLFVWRYRLRPQTPETVLSWLLRRLGNTAEQAH
ncbi:MAG: tetraacyldisaccharide 4'-kinase [Acidobacteriota bacterium]